MLNLYLDELPDVVHVVPKLLHPGLVPRLPQAPGGLRQRAQRLLVVLVLVYLNLRRKGRGEHVRRGCT